MPDDATEAVTVTQFPDCRCSVRQLGQPDHGCNDYVSAALVLQCTILEGMTGLGTSSMQVSLSLLLLLAPIQDSNPVSRRIQCHKL